MRNPFKRGGDKSYDKEAPGDRQPSKYYDTLPSTPTLRPNKLLIIAAVATFIFIIIILAESVVI
ncbi:MAG TPA: hypothetical protein VIP70_09295, partial [Nitrososphaeraceae archaeon]